MLFGDFGPFCSDLRMRGCKPKPVGFFSAIVGSCMLAQSRGAGDNDVGEHHAVNSRRVWHFHRDEYYHVIGFVQAPLRGLRFGSWTTLHALHE